MDIFCRLYFRAFQTRQAIARKECFEFIVQEKKRVLERSGPDEVPKSESKLHAKSAFELNSLFGQGKNRFYTFYKDAFRVYVKKQSSQLWIKSSNWNHICGKTTVTRAGAKTG